MCTTFSGADISATILTGIVSLVSFAEDAAIKCGNIGIAFDHMGEARVNFKPSRRTAPSTMKMTLIDLRPSRTAFPGLSARMVMFLAMERAP